MKFPFRTPSSSKQNAKAQKPKRGERSNKAQSHSALDELHTPKNIPYTVNIVAIHGLETTSERTWVYKKKGEEKEINWLDNEEMLPAAVPEARIFTYNWDANYYRDGNSADLNDHGRSLISYLHGRLKHEGEQRKPIIFIASCFGGLVLAKALAKASSYSTEECDYMKILNSTVGIVFLATPFGGTGLAKMAKLQVKVGNLLWKGPSNSLIPSLHSDYTLLRELRSDFLKVMGDYQMPIYYFYEQKKTELFRKLMPGPLASFISALFLYITKKYVVEQESACLCDVNKCGICATHSQMNKFPSPEHRNYIPVRDKIESFKCAAEDTLYRRQKAVRETRYLLPDKTVEEFVGRQKVLEEIIDLIYRSDSPEIRNKEAITGVGGVGKTQLAFQVACKIKSDNEERNKSNNQGKDQNWSIFWISGSTYTSFQEGYRQIAEKIGLNSRSEDLLNVVNTKLQKRPGHWLLIIDDVDDTEEGPHEKGWRLQKDKLPSGGRGFVLMTTRTRHVANSLCEDPPRRLKPLYEDEAKQLFEQPFKEDLLRLIDGSYRVKELLELLMKLPLAIKLASRYMTETETSITKYLEKWKNNKDQMIKYLCCGSRGHDLNNEEVQQGQEAVAAAWLISFDRIRKKHPKSVGFFTKIAFYHDKSIPVDALKSGNDADIDTDEITDVLVNYSFVSRHDESIDIHPLIQMAMRNWLLQQGKSNQGARSAIENLSFPFPTLHNKKEWEPKLPHAVSALGYQRELIYHHPTWHLLYKTGQAYYVLENYERAKEFHERARILEGIDISTRPSAALNARYQGNFEGAEDGYREAIEQQLETYPSELIIKKNIACTLLLQGKYEEGRVEYQKVFETEKSLMGGEHPATISTMDSLAFALKSEGKYQEAKEKYRQALNAKKRRRADSKPDVSTIASMEKLAAMHQHQGEYPLAEELYQEALWRKVEIFGKKNPSTLVTCESLALVFGRQQRYQEAENMCRRTLELKREVMDPSHPSIKRTEVNMALFAKFK